MDAPLLKIEIQRSENDCGVAVLAMLTSHSYEETLILTGTVVPNVLNSGMTWRELKKVARKLGFKSKVKRARDINLETDIGALCIASKLWKVDHLVVLREGLIIDTDSSLWEPDIYLKYHQGKVKSLMLLEPLL